MKTIIRLTCLAMLLAAAGTGWAETFTRGMQSCDFSVAEKYYQQDPNDLSYQDLYATCLIIKGDDANGLPMLYHLADQKSSVTANFFLADYLSTDGRFANPSTKKTLDEAINYYYRTLAIIDLIPTYPEPDYFFHEKNHQMHLNSTYRVPRLYLARYQLGAAGDYGAHLMQWPGYEGESKDTFPKYNTFMRDSLNQGLQQAQHCRDLPRKRYHNPAHYKANAESCTLLVDLIKTLIPLEEQRQQILLDCRDENGIVQMGWENCPKYYESHKEINNLMEAYSEAAFAIFRHI